ncbi:MAG: hypothetical protein J6D03_06590 [Clostridia bacterium]|nr:hypothetical protein [Clostridia bacterium]
MFKFKCNNTEWTIEEVDEATINNEEKNDYTLGLTFYKTNKIWLLNNNVNKIRTLKHELMHVWLWEYGHSQDEDRKYSYEEVCEIVASSNSFVNEVVEQYIKGPKTITTSIYIDGNKIGQTISNKLSMMGQS